MSIETFDISVNGLPVRVVRKPIKNLHLGVYPPHGQVRVAAPLGVSNEAVRLAVIGKLAWIKRQQDKFETQARQSERDMVSGECHYFLGQRYRMRFICNDSSTKVVVRHNGIMELHAPVNMTPEQRERILKEWYRTRLKELIPPLIDKWQPILDVEIAEWRVKRMKTKWGTCNTRARRIWLNLELAKKPLQCLEYIVVHELIHLKERAHNERFLEYLNKSLPHWQMIRAQLNTAPLAHENWDY